MLFLTLEQIEKLLAVKKTAIRATIMLVRQNIDRLLEHYGKQGMAEGEEEYIFLQDHLDETTI